MGDEQRMFRKISKRFNSQAYHTEHCTGSENQFKTPSNQSTSLVFGFPMYKRGRLDYMIVKSSPCPLGSPDGVRERGCGETADHLGP